MKLAAPVHTARGQLLVGAGTILDSRTIREIFKRGVAFVQISETQYTSTFSPEAFAAVERAVAPPVLARPVDTASNPVDPRAPAWRALPGSDGVQDRRRGGLKLATLARLRDLLKESEAKKNRQWAERHGPAFRVISAAIGDTSSTAPGPGLPVYSELLATLARDLNMSLIFDRAFDPRTIALLTREIVSTLSSRPAVMDLLIQARSVNCYLLAHMTNVALLSMHVGVKMGLAATAVQDLSVAALLHDIGMLTVRDRASVEKHAEAGARLILRTPGARPQWAKYTLEHHERLDGSGYPNRRQADDLSTASRILQICDVYAALTSDRPHRIAEFPDVGMDYVLGKSDKFDFAVSRALCRAVGFYPDGCTVDLSTGGRAQVVAQTGHARRPVVRLLTGKHPELEEVLDLRLQPDLRVTAVLRRRNP